MTKVTINYNPTTGDGTLYFGDALLCVIQLPRKQVKTIKKLITEHILKEQARK